MVKGVWRGTNNSSLSGNSTGAVEGGNIAPLEAEMKTCDELPAMGLCLYIYWYSAFMLA